MPNEIDSIVESTLARIKKSEFYDSSIQHRIHICNTSWRWRLFSNALSSAGGITFDLPRRNVFIRPSLIAENRIIPPKGPLADANDRDLVYYLSHETTHSMTIAELGVWDFHNKMPKWLIEGYADYIGKKNFNFTKELDEYKQGSWRLSIESSLYVRYHLYVHYLLEVKNVPLQDILMEPPSLELVDSQLQDYIEMANGSSQ